MKKLLLSIIALFSLSMVLLPAPALAQNKGDVCAGVGQASGGSDCAPAAGSSVTDINQVVRTAIRIFQVIVGIIALVFMVIAGQRFITSGGESNKIVEARNTLLYSAIGIAVVGLSELFIAFVLNRVRG